MAAERRLCRYRFTNQSVKPSACAYAQLVYCSNEWSVFLVDSYILAGVAAGRGLKRGFREVSVGDYRAVEAGFVGRRMEKRPDISISYVTAT